MQGFFLLSEIGFHIAQRRDQQPGFLFFQFRQLIDQGVDLLAHLRDSFANAFQIVKPVACHQRFEAMLQAGDQRANGFHVAALLRLIELDHNGVGFFFAIVGHQIRVAELAGLSPQPF